MSRAVQSDPASLLLLQLPTANQRMFPTPPLGIATIMGYLRPKGYRVEAADLEILTWHLHEVDLPWLDPLWRQLPKRFNNRKRVFLDTARVFRHLQRGGDDPLIGQRLREWDEALPHHPERFSYVGFSVLGQYNLGTSLCFAQYLKQRHQAKIVFGGGFITPRMKRLLSLYPFLDFLVIGEGELALEQLLRGDPLSEIENLVYQDARAVVSNPERRRFLPFSRPDFSPFPLEKYRELTVQVMPLIVSKGCRNACNFCITGRQGPLLKDPAEVVRELEASLAVGRTNLAGMVDNAFNIDRAYSIEVCRQIIDRGLQVKWSAYLIPEDEDEAYFRLLRQAGCIQLRWGIETNSPRLLKKMNKRIDLEQIGGSLRRAHAAGIWNHVLFLCDHPEETLEDWQLTMRFIAANHEHFRSAVINVFDLQRIDPSYHDGMISRSLRGRARDVSSRNLYGIAISDFRSPEFSMKYHGLRAMLRACGIFLINNTSAYKRDFHRDHYYFRSFLEALADG